MSVNAKDSFGQTPLHCAIHYSQVEVIKLLLEMDNIDENIRDNLGETPLSVARRLCSSKREQICKMISK